ncbi:MAG: hypothetical protein HFG49_02380 [Lachnospiraceae bacterium]|jgi:hypothetical protein|nr:hypothetical protein [Lachnospiraceae bacterium]
MNRWKRPFAIVCLILIGILIAGAIILAFMDTELSRSLLMADLFCLMVIPACFYGYQMLLNLRKQKDGKQDPK